MPQRILLNSGYSMIVALVWTALFHLNDFFFNAAEVALLVSLIFLPAVLRPVAVLLFWNPWRRWAYAGLRAYHTHNRDPQRFF